MDNQNYNQNSNYGGHGSYNLDNNYNPNNNQNPGQTSHPVNQQIPGFNPDNAMRNTNQYPPNTSNNMYPSGYNAGQFPQNNFGQYPQQFNQGNGFNQNAQFNGNNPYIQYGERIRQYKNKGTIFIVLGAVIAFLSVFLLGVAIIVLGILGMEEGKKLKFSEADNYHKIALILTIIGIILFVGKILFLIISVVFTGLSYGVYYGNLISRIIDFIESLQ